MKRVCICGTSRTLKQIPTDVEGLEYWVLNDMYKLTRGFSRLFQIHALKDLYVYGDNHVRELASLNKPIYMQEVNESIPMSVKYPVEEIISEFGIDYFQSSVDFMLAMAIYEGYEEIYLYGVDMSVAGEYETQKPSGSFWLGVAKGRGINIYLPDNCDLLKSYFRYGYEDEKRETFIVKAKAQMKELDTQMETFNKNYYTCKGAKETWEFITQAIERG